MTNYFISFFAAVLLFGLFTTRASGAEAGEYKLILNRKEGYYFTTPRSENPTDPTANLYSILSEIEADKSSYQDNDGKYQFKLIYGKSDGTQFIIEWKQSNWLTTSTITGYEEVNVPTQTFTSTDMAYFHGLGLNQHQSEKSLLDGAPEHLYWFNAVGSMQEWPNRGGSPGFNAQVALTVTLYILVPTTPNPTPPPTDSPYEISLNNWNTLKSENGDCYTYTSSFESWTGFESITTIKVEDGIVIQRSYQSTDSMGSVSDSYDETQPDEIGTNWQGKEALTIDELYENCAEYLAEANPEDTVYFNTFDDNNIIKLCGYVPDNCMDDCFQGISIDSLEFCGDEEEESDGYELILRQDQGEFFPDLDDAKDYGDYGDKLYSIIGMFDDESYRNSGEFQDENDKFTFRLEYDYNDDTTDTLIWKQSNWILSEYHEGVEFISDNLNNQDTTGYGDCAKFAGLVSGSANSNGFKFALMDGNNEDGCDWWFNAVGTIQLWQYTNQYKSSLGFPAYETKMANAVRLYILKESQEPTSAPTTSECRNIGKCFVDENESYMEWCTENEEYLYQKWNGTQCYPCYSEPVCEGELITSYIELQHPCCWDHPFAIVG